MGTLEIFSSYYSHNNCFCDNFRAVYFTHINGDDVATNLGVKTNRTRILGMIIVVILAGVSVSAVGSIGFVGLVIPHIARKLVGVNYRLIIPMSAFLGAMLLVVADLGQEQ